MRAIVLMFDSLNRRMLPPYGDTVTHAPNFARLAERAVTFLEASPCQYEHAVARVEYGLAARSAAELRRGLTLARSCGADGLVLQAEAALATGLL